MSDIEKEKQKIKQRKNKILEQEQKLKFKERKKRTRKLIDLGSLISKAELDHLSHETLYGALLSLSQSLNQDPSIQNDWFQLGEAQFHKEKQEKTPIILQFSYEISKELKNFLRKHNLKYNKFRQEWYGKVHDLDSLKHYLSNEECNIQYLDNDY